MPLTATDFVPKGPVKSADILQFYNLFTGVMADQPVTFQNTLSVGGQQGSNTVPLKLYGATGQTGHLIDLYADHGQAQPGFGFSAIGSFGWGPGGTAGQDTFLSRIASQSGHTSDTPGLLVQPQLEVSGNILPHGSITFPSGAAIADGGGGITNIGASLAVQTNVYVGYDHGQWLFEVQPQVMGLDSFLMINNYTPWATGLPFAEAHLGVRTGDLPDTTGAMANGMSVGCFAGNWLQFNPKFYKIAAGQGWPQIALLLDYDVDGSNAAGGRISMAAGKIGINTVVNPSGNVLQVVGSATVNGDITATRGDASGYHWVGNAGHYYGFDGTLYAMYGASAYIGGVLHLDVNGANPNSGGAYLTFPQAATPKISFYDGGSNIFFGMGINANELYHCLPTGTSMSLRQSNGGGAQVLTFAANNGQITWPSPPYGNESVGPGEPVGYGGSVYISPHAYVYFNLVVGHTVTCQSLTQTSDPRQKSGMSVMADADCMSRIRAAVPVYSYQLAPPSPPPDQISGPSQTPTDIGFDANDIYASSPEFAALDAHNTPVGINYSNMAALLWGALRNLDARCVAKGI